MQGADVKAWAENEGKQEGAFSLVPHHVPLLVLSTSLALISGDFPLFLWILRSKDLIVDLHRDSLGAGEKSRLLNTWAVTDAC